MANNEMNETFTETCYRKTQVFPESQRKARARFYLKCMKNSDGCENERYSKLYVELMSGEKNCTDTYSC
jgi:hypothetical protein